MASTQASSERAGGAQAGTLYLVAGPIGNLEDITLRALRVLREVDLVAAEDTRQVAKLLSHYQIDRPTVSYHAHNWRRVVSGLLQRLRRGESVALLSDAGMPGISDPGGELVALASGEGIAVTVLPGPSALVAAAALSGFHLNGVSFWGFLPRRPGRRKRFLGELLARGEAFVFFESPHRIQETLADLAALEGERPVAVARELTKMFEEMLRGSAGQVAERVAAKEPRGEFTVVVAGAATRSYPGPGASAQGRAMPAARVQSTAPGQGAPAEVAARQKKKRYPPGHGSGAETS